MSISIRAILHAYAATLTKKWAHDRSKTVGASEIGQCARKIWFDKHGTAKDAGFVETLAGLRGNIIENYFWLPGLRATLPESVRLLFAGEEQETLIDGYLSATTDGLLVGVSRDALAWKGIPDIESDCLNLDCKSIDPRFNLHEEKSAHFFQAHVQMGLMRSKTDYRPIYSDISYTDASFFDKIDEFIVKFDQRIYDSAHVRAKDIMTAPTALDMPPEGKIAGGKECKDCAWASHCAAVTVAGVPREARELTDNLAGELRELCAAAKQLHATGEYWSEQHAQAIERVKQFLREHGTRRYMGDGWSVNYSAVNGRETLDIQAIEAAGIDLKPYYKTGKSSERLTIK